MQRRPGASAARGSGTASRNTSNAAIGPFASKASSTSGWSSPKCAEHGRPEPQNAGAARVIPGRRVGGGLQIVGRRARQRRAPPARRPSRRRDRVRAACSRQSRGPRRPARNPAATVICPSGRVVAIERPQLEQRDIGKAAIGVAPRRLDQVRQQRSGASRRDRLLIGLTRRSSGLAPPNSSPPRATR